VCILLISIVSKIYICISFETNTGIVEWTVINTNYEVISIEFVNIPEQLYIIPVLLLLLLLLFKIRI